MKSSGLIDKTLHFLVHNSFLFTVIVMGLVHATLLLIMLIAGVMPLVYLNAVSVIVYLFCTVLSKFGHIMPVYISILLEVSIYSVAATYFVGWHSGTYCFICSIIPIIIYFGSFLFKREKRWIIALIYTGNFALYIFLYFRFHDEMPVYELSHAAGSVLMIFSSFVAVFSIIFYNTIYIYTSESERNNLEKKNVQLSDDAHKDALTDLLNRRGFLPVMEALMKDERSRNFCVAFCDIDNFKRVNDSYGHDGGDEVLRHITKILKNEMQGCDICRWGGEEMVILMRDYDFAVAKEKMEYIRKIVETNPTVFYNKRIPVTITIGLEENKDIYNNPEELIKVADERMYYGKKHGKNIVISK